MTTNGHALPSHDLRTWTGTRGTLALVTGRQMGTDCACYIVAERDADAREIALQAWALIAECDRAWSRFRADSDLVAFNESAAKVTGPVQVSPLMVSLLQAALWAHEYSHGIVDASVLPAVVAAGYDRDYSLIEQSPTNPVTLAGDTFRPNPLSDSLTVSRTGEVTVARPVQVDSGGIGKGLAADLVTRLVSDAGATGALISLGGDVGTLGCDQNGDPWTVTVEQAQTVGAPRRVALVGNEGIATSSTLLRKLPGGHHLIDPRTGRPSRSKVLAATITAPTALEAEVAAKVLVIVGAADAITLLSERDLTATVLLTDGRQYGIANHRNFEGAA